MCKAVSYLWPGVTLQSAGAHKSGSCVRMLSPPFATSCFQFTFKTLLFAQHMRDKRSQRKIPAKLWWQSSVTHASTYIVLQKHSQSDTVPLEKAVPCSSMSRTQLFSWLMGGGTIIHKSLSKQGCLLYQTYNSSNKLAWLAACPDKMTERSRLFESGCIRWLLEKNQWTQWHAAW